MRTVGTPPGLALMAAILGTLTLAVGSALAGWSTVFYAGCLASIAADVYGDHRLVIRSYLRATGVGVLARSVVRDTMFAVVLVGDVAGGRWSARTVAALALAPTVGRFAVLFLKVPVARRLRIPVVTRGLRAPEPTPPPALVMAPMVWLIVASAGPFAMAWFGTVTGRWAPFLVAQALYVGGLVVLALTLVAWLLRFAHGRSRRGYARRAMAAVDRYAPQVIVYFSGGPAALYQLTAWLPTLERLEPRTIVLLRERRHLDAFTTTLPVMCVPAAADLMTFGVPTAQVALYPANVGKNLHLLREPHIKHVFIGHGESDKVSSINPFSRVYDQVWVAGPIARERWAKADVGVHDDNIVEVGRPTLVGVEPAAPRPPGRPLAVLYAPTWEGWTDRPSATSVTSCGLDLVEWMLARPGEIRLLYRPHPLTGSVSHRAAEAQAEILSVIRAAGGGHPADVEDLRRPSARPLVLDSPGISVIDSFNASDVLVSDISSVVPDFVASGKPYVVINNDAHPPEVMRVEYPTVRGAYLAEPRPESWEAILHDIRVVDSMAEARRVARAELLGPPVADPLEPFAAALDALLGRAPKPAARPADPPASNRAPVRPLR